MSKAMRKVTGSLAKSTCTVVFLNQLRSKIGTVNFYLYILILSPPSLQLLKEEWIRCTLTALHPFISGIIYGSPEVCVNERFGYLS